MPSTQCPPGTKKTSRVNIFSKPGWRSAMKPGLQTQTGLKRKIVIFVPMTRYTTVHLNDGDNHNPVQYIYSWIYERGTPEETE